MSTRKLSPIEHTVLGIAWKRGPSTTYALMKELSSSTSTYYRSRAGTAYPVVERLVKSGLLSQSGGPGPRGERRVSVTEAGVDALREWLADPVTTEEAAYTVDLIRLRVFYLGLLDQAGRSRFLLAAESKLLEQLAACEASLDLYEGMGDSFSRLTTFGVVLETRARLEWIRTIKDSILQLPAGPPPRPAGSA